MGKLREPVNFFTHFVPAVIAFPACYLLIRQAASPIGITAALIYGACTVVLFTVSAVYHGFPKTEYGIRFWQKFDHCCIYLMIAGSYSPTALLVFEGWLRWAIFALVWAIAAAGCILKIFNKLKSTGISVAIYISMGCLVLPLLRTMLTILPGWAIFWLLFGGVFYIGGTYYYAKDKQLYRYMHSHELWHVFVILGALSHYIYNMVYIFTLA